MKNEILKIQGMHCAACAATIAKNLSKQAGIKSANVNYATEKANLEFDESKISLNNIKQVVKATGYEVVDDQGTPHMSKHGHDHMQVDQEKKQKLKTYLSQSPQRTQRKTKAFLFLIL